MVFSWHILLKIPLYLIFYYKIKLRSSLIDRTRYTWEIFTSDGVCLRSQYWYKHPDTALAKAKAHIERELAVTQIVEVVGWV